MNDLSALMTSRRRVRTVRLALAALCAALVLMTIAPSDARAHPHVWIDGVVELQFDQDSAITGVRVYWAFDEFYSVYAVEGLDGDGDGTVSSAELRPLVTQTVKELRDFEYFTFIDVDGSRPEYGEVTEYGMHHINGRVAMWFHLPLAEPVDPRTAKVAVSMYDPTFYVAVDLDTEQPVRLSGAMPAGCSHSIAKPQDSEDDPQYSESFFQGLDGSEAIGERFAYRVRVTCEPAS